MKKYVIRELKANEYYVLKDFLYEAIYQKNEKSMLPKEVVKEPALKVYIENFGEQPDDYCFCAEADKNIVGAVWVRIIDGFGSLDNETPEFAISLYKEYRGQGIGTDLMKSMLAFLLEKNYKRVSLAVQKDNYAVKMYENVGFKTIVETEEEYIMEYRFIRV